MSKYLPEFQKGLDRVLSIDPSLRSVIEQHEFPAFLSPKLKLASSFEYLVGGVLSQQVSGAAARAIRSRFVELCGSQVDFPTPEKVLQFDVEQLRSAGLSRRKGAYVLGLAQAYKDGHISDELLQSMDNDAVVDKIVSLHGFGPWSAQMFLIFYLHRMDVFSPADVGIQRGMRRYLKERPELAKMASSFEDPPASPGKSKKAQAKQTVPPDLLHMGRIANKFSPYRTVFQMILWKLSDIQMDTVEGRNADQKKERKRVGTNRNEIDSSEEVHTEEVHTEEVHTEEVHTEEGGQVEIEVSEVSAKIETSDETNESTRNESNGIRTPEQDGVATAKIEPPHQPSDSKSGKKANNGNQLRGSSRNVKGQRDDAAAKDEDAASEKKEAAYKNASSTRRRTVISSQGSPAKKRRK